MGWLVVMGFLACVSAKDSARPVAADTDVDVDVDTDSDAATEGPEAAVVGVVVSGDPGAYDVAVTVSSPDTGCEQYADWWEVVAEDGTLVYRRILNHSHVDEQPFERESEEPVRMGAADVVVVRAHMNTTGYGGAAVRGSASTGFTVDPTVDAAFAPDLETAAPLPEACLW